MRRDPNPHVGFGGPGPHFCLGAHLARRELGVMFRQLFTRLPDIEVVGDPVYLEAMGVPLVGGIKHLPVRFTPTARPGVGQRRSLGWDEARGLGRVRGMRFAFKTAPQNTDWPAMLDVWRAADDIELFESGWTFDHFYPIFSDSNGPCLEGWTVTTALAQATTRLRVGVLVTGIHYRHVAVLANMAAALDIVSGGRLELGVGAGWNVEESEAYGIELGTLTERFDRFDEALEVLVSLLTNEHTTFDGTYYQLTNARNEPKPIQRPHPPIVIGGTGPEAHAALGGPLGPALEPSGYLGRGVEDGARHALPTLRRSGP